MPIQHTFPLGEAFLNTLKKKFKSNVERSKMCTVHELKQYQGRSQEFRKGGGKETSKFVVTPTVSSRLLLRETPATRTNYIER